MNVKFKSVDISGFRSIDKAYISLENQGTVIIKGINEYEDKATSNGSGKSSIFEAIIYAIFEETSAGEKEVENRILGAGFKIELKLEIDGVEYTILREGKNNKSTVLLFKEGEDISARTKTDTNKLIISLLGLTKSLFLDTVFLSQNAVTNLASLQPTARRERLEILTNTDAIINQFKDVIKEKQLYYEAECVEHRSNINKLIGSKEAKINQKQSIQQKIDAVQEEIKKLEQLGDVKEIEAEINQKENIEIPNIDNKISEINKSINQKEEEEAKSRESNEENLEKKSKIDIERNAKRDVYNETDKQINDYKNKIQIHRSNQERLNKEIEEIKNSDKCPTCGRKYEDVNEEHIVEVIKTKTRVWNEDQKNIDELTKLIQEEEVKLTKITEEGLKLKEQIDSIDNDIATNKKVTESIDAQRKTLILEKENYYKEKENLQIAINDLKNKKEQILKTEINNIKEFEDMIVSLDKELELIEQEIQATQDKFNSSDELVNTTKHILQLITKDFRTYLLQNSLKYLNKLLVEYSTKLFSNDGDVIEIENDGVKLNINLGNASYESLSGGEKTRVNIALLLAQKSLANVVGNISFNIIILDEILGYCDRQAENNVIDLISSELNSLESIYMVSHKEVPIGYDNELTVIKDKNGLSRVKNY